MNVQISVYVMSTVPRPCHVIIGGTGLQCCSFPGEKKLIDWDGQTGDEAERCTSGVTTKREGSPLPIRAMQEADHPKAAAKDLVDSFQKKTQQLDEARPEVLSKNRFRRIQRKCN